MDISNLIEKGKIKRYLSVKNRVIYPGGVYHVTHRAPGRELIFLEKNDYLYMLSLLKDTSKKFLWDIFSFALMPNHFHILLRITDANLSEGVKKLCERYAKYFNKKYERKGPVFSRPYRAALCADEIYLLSISFYIHLNPFKAKLCESLIDYRWSSVGLYLNEIKRKSFVDPSFVLNILSENNNKARQQYGELMLESAKIKFKNIIEKPSYIDYFREKMRILLKSTTNVKDGLEEQIEQFKSKDIMKSKKPDSILAKKYLIEQLVARGYKINEIAQKLGLTRCTVYNIYTK